MPPVPRGPQPGGRFVLTLDGVVCGAVIAAEGGDISAPVIREADGSGLLRKRLGQPAPRPIDLSFDLSLNPIVYEWINGFWQGQTVPRDGTLIALDANLKAKAELLFERAVIATSGPPTVDAARKTTGTITVQLLPERTSLEPGSGQVVPGLVAKPKQPIWLTSNFRLQIDALDSTRVTKVEAGPISRQEGAIDLPDVRITLGEIGADTWIAWHESFVVKGKNDPTQEKAGTLALLAPDLKTQVGTVKMSGLGIYRLAPEHGEDKSATATTRLTADLYCQRMTLGVG
jgi:hypothetical protein